MDYTEYKAYLRRGVKTLAQQVKAWCKQIKKGGADEATG